MREKLIQLRNKAGISQMSLAHQMGISRQAVSRWESGASIPTMENLKALADIYDVSLDWLCGDTAVYDERGALLEKKRSDMLIQNEMLLKRTKGKNINLGVLVVIVLILAFFSALVVHYCIEQKVTPIDNLPFKTLDPEKFTEESFKFEW